MVKAGSTYRAVHVVSPGELELTEKPLLDADPGHVRVRVEACGVCHSDSFTVEGAFPIEWPRVPGHEAVGRIDMVGASTEEEGRPARRRRLSWRQLPALWSLPRRGPRELRESEDHGCPP
jgi:D-arabinose 1-dehydrogenase-like Zn-dependent alcohol dehydrogenase